MPEIGLLDRFARQAAGGPGERDPAFLEAIDAVGDGQRLGDVLLDDDDRRARSLDARAAPRRCRRMTIGARPSEISSHSRRRGFDISARPIATICCCPPDSAVRGTVRRSLEDGKELVDGVEIPGPGALRPSAPIGRFSSTVSEGNSLRPSGDHGDAALARSRRAGRPPIGSPSNRMDSRRAAQKAASAS